MVKNELRIPAKSLREFTTQVFIKAGMPPKDAEAEADALIWANLRGVDSHGVLRIPWYLENIEQGIMNPKPNIQILMETLATMLINADHALGPVATIFAVNRVVEKAKKIGVTWALIRNITHQGALGYYSQLIAEKGMAGIIFVCSPPNMAPHGARVAGIANNPISIAVPGKRYPTIYLDMATSIVAGGKLFLAIDKGSPIPEGWALDKDGKPTTDPHKSAALLPIGGPKGSGLALMLECLGSVMANQPLLKPKESHQKIINQPQVDKSKQSSSRPQHVRRNLQNSVVLAIDISTFTDLDTYKDHIDNLVSGLKALPKADGFDEILVPGEPEEKIFNERYRYGIPLPLGTINNLINAANGLSVELPSELKK